MMGGVPPTHRGPIEPRSLVQLLLHLLVLDELVDWLEEVKVDVHDDLGEGFPCS